MHDPTRELLPRALLLDLELSAEGRVREVGALLGGEEFRPRPSEAADVLARCARRAEFVLGHHLVEHDLARWRELHPAHALLDMPVIDTLVLSPLCFPENPYHRLVKDYKLVRESRNDPVADARQAGVLFEDEVRALAGIRQADPAWFGVLHFLLATPDPGEPGGAERTWNRFAAGMDRVFGVLGGTRPSADDALGEIRELAGRAGCRQVVFDAMSVATMARRLTLAYVLAWLRVGGANSVLPPWVRLRHPETVDWTRRLRDVPCADPGCAWCVRVHDPRRWLRELFGHDDFRPVPANPAGGSLQADIVRAGMRDESLLAILPTGGGKSICFQLPALARNYRRGVLTLVISPLQALMKDQVDGLVRRTHATSAAALYGLLTPPERGDVLRRVRMGDIGILYVSPEQLRNRSFREAIARREIGCWVFDEAHCLSKWGHDFRPDYLYAGRFIREFARTSGQAMPAIACFTATAKQEVRDEILAYFRTETGRELRPFEGGVERDNLEFEVQPVPVPAKFERLHDLLLERLGTTGPGSGIVFHATRAATEESASFLCAKGWKAAHFHAGLTPPEKKRVQNDFLAGEIRVICATNAFGMGIDKDDVRLVIHADTPGSLENYLQEAGRAGRDGHRADCVLLYDEADCEAQFRMGAHSELTRRDIAQILRGLRKRSARVQDDELVVTTGEILRDEDLDTSLDPEDRGADTKVRAAVAWLERAGFLQRDENVTQVFQARPLVRDLDEARRRIGSLDLPVPEQALWFAILRELINAPSDDSLTVDELAMLPEFRNYAAAHPSAAGNPEYVSARVLRILGSMARVGLLRRDTLLNAFVRHQVTDPSRPRFERVCRVDRALLDLLAIEDPDPEGWLPLSLRLLHQRLADQGVETSLELTRNLLVSLSQDGRGFAGSHGSLDLRHVGSDLYRVRVRRSWQAIGELADKRRRVAGVALDVILGRIPAGTTPSAELLVPFAFDDIVQALDRDLLLRSEVKEHEAAIARGLLFLHEQNVIQLQQGLAVFRSAMTLRLRPERRGERYQVADYLPLHDHYQERILQVHVMGEYARRGMEQIRQARALVLAYFTLHKEAFLQRFLPTRPELLAKATTARSFERIVTSLGNPAQIRIVSAPRGRNLLVLAGPGSGKTRVVVHRCAYLLRVERVPARGILVCCFNRAAALELRRRLVDLVGDDARGVTILTYHGLALRLLGHSHAARAESPGSAPADIDFDALIRDAVALLRGERLPSGVEPDDVRDRLLAGFQHILVDEYQDIDAPQYEMIGALAGRTLEDPDRKLAILAVGDDDQNIYAFRGANVEYIRRFQEDYQAEIHHLVENYRATAHLVEASNRLISANRDRMKVEHPIRVDRGRHKQPPGGPFGSRDPVTQGRVQVLRLPSVDALAPTVLAELARLRDLGVADLSACAVLSSTHRELARVRAAAEAAGLPVRWHAGRPSLPPLHRIREIARFLAALGARRAASPPDADPSTEPERPAHSGTTIPLPGGLARATDLLRLAGELFPEPGDHPWVRFLLQQLEAWRTESADAELPVVAAREFLYEACADRRRDFDAGTGVTLATVHAAKGTEYDHVLLVGPWNGRGEARSLEETRRAFYVGMTRARHSLAILDQDQYRPGTSLAAALEGPGVLYRDVPPVARDAAPPVLEYETLGMEDLNLGYPAFLPPDHALHRALAALRPGNRLNLARRSLGDDAIALELVDPRGTVVARLSRRAQAEWIDRLDAIREIRLLAVVRRSADQESDAARRDKFRVAEWEIPLVEIVAEST